MRPTYMQIATSAYDRWCRRGGGHGHDQHDWISAENDLLFALNYRVIAQIALDRPRDGRERRHCRFCERGEPATSFGTEMMPVPEFLGLAAPLARHECDECRAQFRTTLDDAFVAFYEPFRLLPTVRGLAAFPSYSWDRWDLGPNPACWSRADGTETLVLPSAGHVPIAAFKFLVRLALAALPETDIDEFAATLEWVGNPDHVLDGGAFGGLLVHALLAPRAFPSPWMSLAKKTDEDAPHPTLVALVGHRHVVFQFAVPLGQGDADLDGEPLTLPTVTLPGGSEGPPYECPHLAIPMDSCEERHAAVLELVYRRGVLEELPSLPLALLTLAE